MRKVTMSLENEHSRSIVRMQSELLVKGDLFKVNAWR